MERNLKNKGLPTFNRAIWESKVMKSVEALTNIASFNQNLIKDQLKRDHEMCTLHGDH